jgi:hypothetical protein
VKRALKRAELVFRENPKIKQILYYYWLTPKVWPFEPMSPIFPANTWSVGGRTNPKKKGQHRKMDVALFYLHRQ